MDFTLNDEQQAIADLAGRILGRPAAPRAAARDRAGAATGSPATSGRSWPRPTCSACACPRPTAAAATACSRPCLMLEQVGRTVAPVPFLATLVLGALPARRFGSDAQRAALLPGVIAGRCRAHRGAGRAGRRPAARRCPTTPATARRRRLAPRRREGVRRRPATSPTAMLVPATHRRRPTSRCSSSTRTPTASRSSATVADQPASRVSTLRPRRASVVGADALAGRRGEGAEIVAWITDRAAGRALRRAGRRLRSSPARSPPRTRPSASSSALKIATFQAVAQRRPTPTSTPRRSGSPPGRPRGGSPRACPPTRRWPSPSSGPPRARSGWCTPPSTCTAASASTSTTRSTATSAGPRPTSSPSAAVPATCWSLGARLASEPV